MSNLIKINVTNNSSSVQNFYFFQQPSVYSGGPQVYSNSLLSATIMPSSVYTFLLNLQFYAGVQQQVTPPEVGKASGYSSAIQAINLTPAAGGTPVNNSSQMIVNPGLALNPPVSDPSVQPGAFRIVSPSFNPTVTPYNGGSAVQMPNGQVVLSNFVSVNPLMNLDCQPVLKFYVQTGSYVAGTVMNFTSSSINAALCDATSGFTTFNVLYNIDGTWSITPSVEKVAIHAQSSDRFLLSEGELNTKIYNEAGTGVVSEGYAANTNLPLTISHLTNAAAINLLGTYQVSVNGAPRIGVDCLAKNGNSATFNS